MRFINLTLLLVLLILSPITTSAKRHQKMESAYRLKLSEKSSIQQPTYFACFIKKSKLHPGLSKWTPKSQFTNVYLSNYAQNVQGFTGNGALLTTTGYINSHYFKAYHDDDFPKSEPGYVDAHVLWAGYGIECRNISDMVKLPDGITHEHFRGVIKYRFKGKTYSLTLAGNDYT